MAIKTLTQAEFTRINREVYRLTGVTMDDSKKILLRGRLGRHMRKLEIESYDEYLEKIRRPGPIQDYFVDIVTTHKTALFRTTSVWRLMVKQVLPELAERHHHIKVWSGAASTGQEPASLTIVCEDARKQKPRLGWSVLATDVSPGMVKATQQACFDRKLMLEAARRFPTVNVPTYFESVKSKEDVQLLGPLRNKLQTARHNLLDSAPGQNFHIIFLRNVIIYFTPEDKSRVLRNAKRALAPGGVLVIGEAESLQEKDEEGLEFVSPCVYKKAA